MPSARHILQRRARQSNRKNRAWLFVVGSSLAACTLALSLITFLGGAAAFSWLEQDLPPFEQLSDRFLAQQSSQNSIIVAQDAAQQWQTIDTIVDPLDGPRVWREADTFPQQATAALRSYAPAFPAELLQRELSSPPRLNIPFIDQLSQNAFQQQLQEQYSSADQDAWFLNTAYFGHLSFGLEAAAGHYFQKSADELSLAEIALLIPIPLDPQLNPIDNFAAAKLRQEAVLQSMVDQGNIDRETFVSARFSPVSINPPTQSGPTAEFVALVRQDAEQILSPAQLLWGELTIFTTLDLDLQQQTACLARAHVGRLSGNPGSGLPTDEALLCPALAFLPELPAGQGGRNRQVSEAAAVVIDPRSGEIKALSSTSNANSLATQPTHQPGTAFTPFALITALSQGLNPATMLLDIEKDFGTPYNGVAYIPQNDDGLFLGPTSLRAALAADRFVPAIELMARVGPENAVRNAQQLGITSLDTTLNRYGLSLVVGGGEVSVLDMGFAYTVLANNGRMNGGSGFEGGQLRPRSIEAIENSRGDVVFESTPFSLEILNPAIAFVVNDILADPLSRCPAFGCPNVLELPGRRPAAVKVGTTNDYRDGWTIGYTPQLVTAVWVGNANSRPMDGITGQEGAAPIWHGIMGYALQDLPPELWTRPAAIVTRLVCEPSGLLATDVCPSRQEIFISGTEPTSVDTMIQEVMVNRLNGRLATQDTPPDLIESRIYTDYPEEAAEWAAANNIPDLPTEYDTLQSAENEIIITSPAPFAVVGDQVEIRGDLNLTPGDTYRLSYYEGLTPDALNEIVGERRLPISGDLLGRWDTGSLEGLYTILLTVFRPDGSFSEFDLQVTIDRIAPEISLLTPEESGQQEISESRVSIEVEAEDDIALEGVYFAIDAELSEPFAVRTEPPYRADLIMGFICQSVLITARDKAGNENQVTAGPFCPDN